MKRKYLTFVKVNALSIICLLTSYSNLNAADLPPVQVLAHGEHRGTNIVYKYKIINNSTHSFNNVTIGSVYDQIREDTRPQLKELPIGWSYGEEGEVGIDIIIPPSSTTQPDGWDIAIYGHEGVDGYYLKWYLDGDNILKGLLLIQPNQTLDGFSVTLPHVDKSYLKGSFRIGFGDGTSPDFTAPIELEDTTPPTLFVTLTPSTLWPPNQKLIPITAAISAHDNFDPAPEIKLESITANEPLVAGDITDAQYGTDDRRIALKAKRAGQSTQGRIYTFTYTATDASGNKATTTAHVTVPHDQGK